MALWPNARRDILGQFPTLIASHAAALEGRQPRSRQVALFANQQVAPSSSVPEGAVGGRAALLLPLVGGGMASGASADAVEFSGTGVLLKGGPMTGATAVEFAGTGALSLNVTLTGAGTIEVSGTGGLALTIGLAGDAAFSLTGTGGLSMIVPFEGAASFGMSGAADLRGLLSLKGDATPFTELSPETLARAVWAELLESGYTAKELMRLLTAVAVGKTDIDTSGASPVVKFRDPADTADRVTATMSGSERASVALNP